MKANEILIGAMYAAKVSGRVVPVRVLRKIERFIRERSVTHWEVLNTMTGRTIVVRSCQRFRKEI